MEQITVSDLIQYSVGLDDNWEFDKLFFDEENQRVDVHISHSGDSLVCPETGEYGMRYDHRKLRSWRHASVHMFYSLSDSANEVICGRENQQGSLTDIRRHMFSSHYLKIPAWL